MQRRLHLFFCPGGGFRALETKIELVRQKEAETHKSLRLGGFRYDEVARPVISCRDRGGTSR